MTVAGIGLFGAGVILVVLRLQDGLLDKVFHPTVRKSLLQPADLVATACRP